MIIYLVRDIARDKHQAPMKFLILNIKYAYILTAFFCCVCKWHF